MKLFLLEAIRADGYDPGAHVYDTLNGGVVRAPDEETARALMDSCGGDECRGGIRPWLNAEFATCTELSVGGAEELILCDLSTG